MFVLYKEKGQMNTRICEQSTCEKYDPKNKYGFVLQEVERNTQKVYQGSKFCHELMVVLEGDISVTFKGRQIVCGKEEMFLVPKNCEVEINTSDNPCKLLCIRSNMEEQICLKDHQEILSGLKYFRWEYSSLKVNEPLRLYLNYLLYSIHNVMPCHYYLNVYKLNMAAIFSQYYTKEEIYKLFYPVLGDDYSFKLLVFKHYQSVTSLKDFAEKTGCSLSTFKRRFKKEFNTSAYKWLQIKKAKAIESDLANLTQDIQIIIDKYHFSGHTSFYNFCLKYLGGTPSEIRKRLLNKND